MSSSRTSSDGSRAATATATAATPKSPGTENQEQGQQHSVWSRHVVAARRTFFKQLLMYFGVTTAVLWCTLPIFWGSSLTLEQYFGDLHIQVVDFDSQASGSNAIAGPYITAALRAIDRAPGPHLTYDIVDPSRYPGGPEQVMDAVGKSGPWGAVVVHANATSAWRNAVTTGNPSYDPSGSVGVYYSGARFYQIVLLFVVAFMNQNVHGAVSSASQAAAQQFLCANAGATPATQNAGALTTASASPAAIGSPFGFYRYDVAPITAWASAAPMEAGLLYLTIFTFHFALLSYFGRMFSGLFVKLKFRSLVLMRLTFCTIMYFFLGLWYTCINRAFQEPLSKHVGDAGFVVLWALSFVTLLAVGLPMESMISLLTIRWFPYFLIFWIILNLTSSFLPIDLMQRFYRWGYAFPFYNNVQATKVILYGIQPNEFLGRYFGILFGWVGVNLVGVTFFTALERRRADR